jgi:hypothetical protein
VDRWLCVCVGGLFCVSGGYWVGGIRWEVGKFVCFALVFEGMGVLKESVGGGWAGVFMKNRPY